MGRKRQPDRIVGIYKRNIGRKRWILAIAYSGERNHFYFATEKEAKATAKILRKELDGEKNVEDYLAEYELEMRRRELKADSIKVNMKRIRNLIPETLGEFNSKVINRLLDSKQWSIATKRSTLRKTQCFAKWLSEKYYISKTQYEDIKKVKVLGKENRGKPQLTIDESKIYLKHCLNDISEVGLMCAFPLLFGLRASEVCDLIVKDIDGDGTILRVSKSKTEAGVRNLIIPEILKPRIKQICRNKMPTDSLWNREMNHKKLLRYVNQRCKDAGVSVVGSHGLRGTHASLSVVSGATPEAVSKSLGHTSSVITKQHYIAPQAMTDSDIKIAAETLLAPKKIDTEKENNSINPLN